MSFTIPTQTPAAGLVIPSATYGVQLKDTCTALNAGFHVPLFPRSSGIVAASGLQGAGFLTVQSSGAGTIKPEYPVLAFDKDTDEGRIWNDTLHRLYASTMTLNFAFYMPTVTSGTVVMSAQIACWSDTDTSASAKVFAAANSCAAITVPAAALKVAVGSITMTNADSAAAIDKFSLALFRDVSEDTAAEDVYLIRADLFFNLS